MNRTPVPLMRRGAALAVLLAALLLALTGTVFAADKIEIFDQCRNQDGTGGPSDECVWTNGNAGTNSVWSEGDGVPQRLVISELAPNTQHTILMNYATSKDETVAYDYLVNWDWSENWIDQNELCAAGGNLGGLISGCDVAPITSTPIPTDPLLAPFGVVQPAGQSLKMIGGTLNSMTYTGAAPNFTGPGDDDRFFEVTFTTPATCPDDECTVFLFFAAHISTQVDWGVGNSASGISGSPYHVRVLELNGATTGNRDNQLQLDTPLVGGSITIIKDAIPDDPQDFDFNLSGGTTNVNFQLDDDGNNANDLSNTRLFPSLAPGSYTASELNIPAGWELTGITCTASDGSSYTVDLDNDQVVIDLQQDGNAAGEVTCTFTDEPPPPPSPEFTVEKTADPTFVISGDEVTFGVTITNTGDLPVTIDSLLDDIYGDIADGSNPAIVSTTCSVPQALAVDDVYSCSFVAVVTGQPGSTHTDTVTACDTSLDPDVCDDDPADVVLADPAITVEKTADPTLVVSGDEVTFGVKITNTGDYTVTVDSLLDDIYGDIADAGNPAIVSTTCTVPQELGVGEEYTCSFVAVVTGEPGSTHTDTVTACDTSLDPDVCDDDPADVVLADPALTVEKTANPGLVASGDEVTFGVKVTNTGDYTVTVDSLIDDIYGDIADAGNPAIVSTTCVVPQELGVNEEYSCSFVAVVTGEPGSTHTDTVTACDTSFDPDVCDDDPADVVLADPELTVDKTASPGTVVSGANVTFGVKVTNTGDITLTVDSLVDDIYGDITDDSGIIVSTTCAVPQELSVNEEYTCSFVAPVTGPAGSTHTDTVTACDTSLDPDVCDDDPADVGIVGPAFECPAGPEAFRQTDIVGMGIGGLTAYKATGKVFVPNYTNAVSLYGQLAGKKTIILAKYGRFIYPNNTYENVNPLSLGADDIFSPAYRDNAVYWFGTDLNVAAHIRGKIFTNKTTKPFTQRAFILYPTYTTQEPRWNYFQPLDWANSSTNHVYWEPGWFASQSHTINLGGRLEAPATITVKIALVDNDPDARPVNVTVKAMGGQTVSQTQSPNNPSLGDQLNILTFTLNAPIDTDRIVIDLVSPEGTGDSVAITGVTANFACEVN